MHQRDAEVGSGIGPRTVITLPERTCAADAFCHGSSFACGRRREAREDARVEPDRDEDDRPVTIWVKNGEICTGSGRCR